MRSLDPPSLSHEHWLFSPLRGIPPVPLLLLGLGIDVLAAGQLLGSEEPLCLLLIKIGVPVLLSLPGFLAVAYTIQSERKPLVQARILLVIALFLLIGAVNLVVIGIVRFVSGNPVVPTSFALTLGLGAGFGVGGAFGIYYDQAHQSRTLLAEQVEKTNTLNERLQVLLRLLRHNVRNDIQVIHGWIEEFHSTELDSHQARALEWIEGAADRLYEQTEQALWMQELDPESETVVVDLVDVVNESLAQLDESYGDATIRTDMPASALVQAKYAIDIAVFEVIENALRHNDPDDLEIDVDIRIDGSWVHLTIADTGTGVPEAERKALMGEREGPLTHSSGIGLWLIRWAVESSAGDVAFEANEPQGFKVRMTLPSAEQNGSAA